MKKEKALTLKTLTKSNVWDIQENDVFRLWEAAEKDADLKDCQNIAFVAHFLCTCKKGGCTNTSLLSVAPSR